jgi:hypothetical protein
VPALFFADRLDLLVGFRQLKFDENLSLSGSYTDLPTVVDPVAQAARYIEGFDVHNQFYGAQVGFASHTECCGFTCDVTGKVALGGIHHTVVINGETELIDARGRGAPGQNLFAAGGILTQPTNIGRFNHGDFSCVPELTLNFGYRLTQAMTVFAGYNFLFATNMARAGNQIDGVDGRQIFLSPGYNPNTSFTHPVALGEANSTFWVQGLNFGVLFTY